MTQSVRTYRKHIDKEAKEMASNELEVHGPAATPGKMKKIVSGVELNRRHFMAALGAAGVAAGTGLLSAPVARAQQTQSLNAFNPTYVLNFLLNIKFLKATLYSFITTGNDLPANYASPEVTLGTGQMYNKPGQVTFSGTNAAQITDMFNEMYYDELNQIVNLQALLGVAALPRTTINLLGTSAASTSTNSAKFAAPPATAKLTAAQALGMARMLEDVSASAFAYALPYFTGPELTLVAQILAVDGFHAGALRLACIQNGTPYLGTFATSTIQAGTQSGSTTVYTTGTVPSMFALDQPILGIGIPPGATIAAISSNPSATFTGTVAFTGSQTITSVSVPSGTSVVPGMPVTGTNIPPLTVITAVDLTVTHTVTISNPVTTPFRAGVLTVGQSIITLSEPATATSSTYIGADPYDVEPGDPGVQVPPASPAAGPLTTPASLPLGIPLGFYDTAATANATTVTPAGLAYARTFSQVLAILYANAVSSTYSGGYFPIGVAGSINTV